MCHRVTSNENALFAACPFVLVYRDQDLDQGLDMKQIRRISSCVLSVAYMKSFAYMVCRTLAPWNNREQLSDS